MMSVGSNNASTSGAGSNGGPLTCAWISLTLEEQLTNFDRTIRNLWPCGTSTYGEPLKSITKVMKELRIDPCANIESLLPEVQILAPPGVLLGTTPLHWAVLMDDRTMVHYILTSGKVDIDASTRVWKETALHYAIFGGNHDIVEDLLEYKADVGICNIASESILYYLVNQKDSMFGILKTILANNVNIRDNAKNTALHHAAMEGATDVVAYLLSKKADVNVHNQSGYTPLHNAIGKGSLDVVTHFLQQNADANALTDHRQSPLHCAIEVGSLDVITCLLQQNVVVNVLDDVEKSPLHYAAEKGHQDVVTCLLEHNANVNEEDCYGWSPLHYAAEKGHQDVVTCLLEHNAYVNEEDCYGWSPLHYAIEKGFLDVVTSLLQDNADVNALTKDGLSPLHLAAKEGAMNIVSLLVEHKANVNALTKDGLSPLHFAAKEGAMNIVSLLVEHKANVDTLDKFDKRSPLLLSISYQRVDTANGLIAIGADVHVKDKKDNNALHLAIQGYGRERNMMDIVKLLQERDVDANAKNAQGYSPFCAAVVEGHIEVVKELLRSKEKIKLMEECNGQTVIQIAFDNGHEHIKRTLLECDDVSRYVGHLYRDRQVYVDAANAILVGAALIASVTFASWLQPPLSYTTSYLDLAPSSSNINYVDVQHNVSLRAFWIFNALSFYFAIGTVVFGARSILPRRRMFIKDIVVKLHRNLLITSILLACSVLFVIVAFGIAGCIVLTPILQFQWYMIVPTIFGGLVCLVSLGFLLKSMVEDNLDIEKSKTFFLFRKILNLQRSPQELICNSIY